VAERERLPNKSNWNGEGISNEEELSAFN